MICCSCFVFKSRQQCKHEQTRHFIYSLLQFKIAHIRKSQQIFRIKALPLHIVIFLCLFSLSLQSYNLAVQILILIEVHIFGFA